MPWNTSALAAAMIVATVGAAFAADPQNAPAPAQDGGYQDHDPSAGFFREGAAEYRQWRNSFQRLPEYGEYQYWLRQGQVYLPGQLIPGNPVPGPPAPAAPYGYYDAQGFQFFDSFENPGGLFNAAGDADRQGWLDYCRAKYRSFDPATGMYRATSGELRPCRY